MLTQIFSLLFFLNIFSLETPHNHYHHHHPHQTLNGSTEQLVAPQHQHNITNNVPHRQTNHQMMPNEAPKEILSVSGKKKCSYCCEELGRH